MCAFIWYIKDIITQRMSPLIGVGGRTVLQVGKYPPSVVILAPSLCYYP